MLNFFKKKDKNYNLSIVSIGCLLIHAAKIDENYSENEKKIIEKTLIKLGAESSETTEIMKNAELMEKDSNQILEFTKEAKNLDHKKKLILIEALWSIIYSDKNADLYETSLMRRVAGLIYLDKKIVGDIKLKMENQIK